MFVISFCRFHKKKIKLSLLNILKGGGGGELKGKEIILNFYITVTVTQ